MTNKTKLATLLLIVLAVIPILVTSGSENGRVLGVIEDTTTQTPNSNIDPIESKTEQKQGQIGEIAGGVQEKRFLTPQTQTDIVYEGLAIWSSSSTSSVTSNKFSLATGITVSSATQTLELVVTDTNSELEKDVILLLDRETFQKLGGDPSKQESLRVSVKKN